MATRRDQVGVTMLVQPELDKRAVADVIKNANDLRKQLGKMKVDFGQVAKQSNVSLREIQSITKAASQFSHALKDGAKASFEELKGLGDQLNKAHEEAAALEQQARSAKSAKARSNVAAEQARVAKNIQSLNKQITDWKKNQADAGKQLKSVIRDFQKVAKFGPKEMMRGVGGGVMKMLSGGKEGVVSGMKEVLGSMHKAGKGRQAREALASGDPKAISAIAGSAKAMGVAASLLSVFVKLLMKATVHQSQLNKAMLEGTALAAESKDSAGKYRENMDKLRNAAVGNTYAMLKFGMDSEKSLKLVSAFAREASGSLAMTAAQLKEMGRGDLDAGLLEFTRMATVYGKALGTEATEVASLMGTFTSELGYGAEGAKKAMTNIVKQAQAAQMPVYKFMDIFRQTIPSLDQYTNRMEELVGVIKMLSKAMSPQDVKKFMDAFGKGFDQVDFKQRLKTALVAGVGNVSSILKRDFDAVGKGLVNKMGSMGPKVAEALASGDPVKAMRKVVGEAMAKGIGEPATYGALQKLARSSRLQKRGGALNVAGAMRGAGLMARTEILEKAAGALTGGNIEGLGEHVAKKITGMSEQQYAAILQLQDSMGNYLSQIAAVGRTSSVQVNDNLKQLLGITAEGVAGDEELEKRMKKMAASDPKGVERMVKQAAVMQIEEDTAQGDVMQSMAAEQVDATLSIGDKIENVIGYLLEKLYWLLNEVYGFLGRDLWSWISGKGESGRKIKDFNKIVQGRERATEKHWKESPEQIAAYKEFNKQLAQMVKSNYDSNTILAKNQKTLAHVQENPAAIAELKKVFFKKGGSGGEDFERLMTKGAGKWTTEDQAKWDEIVKASSPEDIAAMLSWAESLRIQSEGAQGLGRGDKKTERRKTQTEAEISKARKDVDERTKELYEKRTGKVKVRQGTPMTAEQAKQAFGPEGPAGGKPGKPGAAKGGDRQGQPMTFKEFQDQSEADTKAVNEKAQENTEAVVEEHKTVFDVLSSIYEHLKSGIHWSSSFLAGPYQKTLNASTFSAFDRALGAFAPVIAAIISDEEFATTLGNSGWQVASQYKATASQLANIRPGDAGSFDSLMRRLREVTGGRQSGGDVPETGTYALHKGEAVLDAMTYEQVKRGLRGGPGGQGGVHVGSIVINGSGLTEQQLKGAVYGALDEIARKH